MPDPTKKTWIDNLPGDVSMRLGNCLSRVMCWTISTERG